MGIATLSALLLPLLGGFLFSLTFRPLRYLLAGSAGHRLLLVSTALGVGLAVVAHMLEGVILWFLPSTWQEMAAAGWEWLSPFPLHEILAILLGPMLGWVLNQLPRYSPFRAQRKAHQVLGNRLASLLNDAIDQEKPVMFTLRSGKVYVGYPLDSITSANVSAYVEVLPLASGYREAIEPDASEPTAVHFNVHYRPLLDALLELRDGNEPPGPEVEIEVAREDETTFRFQPADMRLVLPVEEIELATIFSEAVYQYFNPARGESANR